MAKQQNKASVLKTGPLPKAGLTPGYATNIDSTTLPKPTLPQWDGWQNIDRQSSRKP